MPRYARLKEPGFDTDDPEFFEVGEVGLTFLEKLADAEPVPKQSSEEEQRAQEQQQEQQQEEQKGIRDHIYTVPSTEILDSSTLQYSSKAYADDYRAHQQQQQQELQNIENGNPNVRPTDPCPSPELGVAALSSTHSSSASGASLQEQLGSGGRGGGSLSGRWQGRSSEEDRSSSRCRAAGCESHHRDNPTSFQDNDNSNSLSPPSMPQCGQWAPSIHRGTPYREREPVLDRQPTQDAFFSTIRGSTQQQQPYSKRSYRDREPVVDRQDPQDAFFTTSRASTQQQQPQHPQAYSKQSYRDREAVPDREPHDAFSSTSRASSQQHPQAHSKQSCTLHSSCNGVRHCQRFAKESTPRECLFTDPMTAPEKKPLPPVMHSRAEASHGGYFSSEERIPTFQRSNSGRPAPSLQRSSSTRDTQGHPSELSLENWRDHPASRSVQVGERTKHRVSFSLTENHELETQKMREKWREPTAHKKKVLQAKQDSKQQPLRYNYEQPGFVEREKENICGGKAYTIYGVKEVKECAKGSSGRHHQLVRAFSLRDNNSSYTKIPRAYSVNASGGRHVMPMDCETCGKGGIGIVFLGLSGNETSFCKSCKSTSGCQDKPQKKKKSIMDYCRKILRLPSKSR